MKLLKIGKDKKVVKCLEKNEFTQSKIIDQKINFVIPVYWE